MALYKFRIIIIRLIIIILQLCFAVLDSCNRRRVDCSQNFSQKLAIMATIYGL